MDKTRQDDQIKKSGDTWILPHGLRFNIPPPPFPHENHAPSQFSFSEHSWLGYLIKMHVYMMPQLNICHMSQYTIGDRPNLKHNITKSMVGLFPLAPHHDYLQYTYHVYLMQMGSKPGCYILLPLQ